MHQENGNESVNRCQRADESQSSLQSFHVKFGRGSVLQVAYEASVPAVTLIRLEVMAAPFARSKSRGFSGHAKDAAADVRSKAQQPLEPLVHIRTP